MDQLDQLEYDSGQLWIKKKEYTGGGEKIDLYGDRLPRVTG
jgi:hypothetical protein